MARPLQLLSVVMVYALGLLIARARSFTLDAAPLMWGLGALILVSLSIHTINEYADYETDSLTQKTQFSGGSGVLPRGLVVPAFALHSAWASLILGVLVNAIGVLMGVLNVITLVLLLIGAFFGWMYSVQPLKLAWRGWGEVTNAVLGGLLLPVYGYAVAARQFDALVVLACLPFALLDFLNLLATTWADVRADSQVGKHTLATRLSVSHLRTLYTLVALMAFALLLVLPVSILPPTVAVSSLLVVPFVVWGWLRYTRTEAPTASVVAMVALLVLQILAYATL
jgi:1,4-dihydroxy-2-naphthoate octaprenyltransferase